MKSYQELLKKIIRDGTERADRTGVGTYSLFGEQFRHDMKDGFPLLTTKKMFFKGIVHELLWMLRGDTNIKYLNDNDVHIWDLFADENGDLGPVYGKQWRDFNNEGVDQIANAIKLIQTDPFSRRILVVTGNPAQEKQMKLPPCPFLFQFYVDKSELSMHVYQRSCDFFLGGPFDLAQYALLLSMAAAVTGKTPRRLIFSYGDVHLYKNHMNAARELLSRVPFSLPHLEIAAKDDIDEIEFGDIILTGYDSYPAIKADIAV